MLRMGVTIPWKGMDNLTCTHSGALTPTSASIQVLCEEEVPIELFSSKNLSDGVNTNK